MQLPAEIEDKKTLLTELCKKYKISKLFIFGSATGNGFTSASDVDLIAEIDNENPVEKGEAIMKFWTELENLFSRKVDLITSPARNPYLQKQIEATKKLVYDGAGI